jgi:hypothetical protein
MAELHRGVHLPFGLDLLRLAIAVDALILLFCVVVGLYHFVRVGCPSAIHGVPSLGGFLENNGWVLCKAW